MAKAAVKKSLTKKPQRAKPMSRSAARLVADKHYGPEPIDITEKGYGEALNWYNYMCELDQAREWLLAFMKSDNHPKADIKAVERLPKYYIPTTIGWVARMKANGNTIPTNYFETRLAELIEQGKQVIVAERAERVSDGMTIRERTVAKTSQVIEDLEEALDVDMVANKVRKFSVYEFFQSKQVSVPAANIIRANYAPMIEELTSDDPQVKEAYGRKLKAELAFWQAFLDDCDRYTGNKKAAVVRKPKAKKVKSAVEVTSKLNYQKEDVTLKIVSRNPAEIIGAQKLFTFNTKTRKLTCYNAMGPAGLGVKGASVIGFDPEQSVSKSLRRPKEPIDKLLSLGKVGLRKFMDEIKTNPTSPSGRINSDTIILRVTK